MEQESKVEREERRKGINKAKERESKSLKGQGKRGARLKSSATLLIASKNSYHFRTTTDLSKHIQYHYTYVLSWLGIIIQ